MSIELSPKDTQIVGTWYEAQIYIFSMGDGWRLPVVGELENLDVSDDWFWTAHELDDAAFAYNKSYGTGNMFFKYFRTADLPYKIYIRLVRDVTDGIVK